MGAQSKTAERISTRLALPVTRNMTERWLKKSYSTEESQPLRRLVQQSILLRNMPISITSDLTKTEKRLVENYWMIEMRSELRSFPNWSKVAEKTIRAGRERFKRRSTKEERIIAKESRKKSAALAKIETYKKEGKTCSCCGIIKKYDCFSLNRASVIGINYRCKDCDAEKSRNRRNNNPKAREEERLRRTRRIEQNPEKYHAGIKRRRESPEWRVRNSLAKKLRMVIKRINHGETTRITSIMGCKPSELKLWLESQFTKRMSWDNYGTYWHVDHIIPVCSFNHMDKNQIKLCWHWTNLRPLEAKANMSKGGKITEPQMNLLLPC